jgi:hypothetical protein
MNSTGADAYRPERGGLSPEQAAHERLIEETAASLGRAMDHAARCKLQAELYRQIGERDPQLTVRLDAQRLEKAMERTW